MTQTENQRITDALRTCVGRYPSQNKAAAAFNGVSAATVSAILAGNHELISDDMWRNVDKQVTPQGSQLGWRIVETTSFARSRPPWLTHRILVTCVDRR